jgi:alpha-L-fucosidase
MLWLDGGWVRPSKGCDLNMTEIIAAARKIQPNLISVDRGQKDENMNVATPEQTVPEVPLDYPWESCITMSDGWGYHYDDTYKSPRTLIHMLIDIVAKGGNLALNVGPMPDGRLPRPALERMEAMGRWLAKSGEAIYGTRAASVASLGKWRFTRAKDGRIFAIRIWNESDAGRVGVFLNVDVRQGDVVHVRHLASGLDIPFAEADGDTRGVILTFPDGFVRDEYADAFEVEYRK